MNKFVKGIILFCLVLVCTGLCCFAGAETSGYSLPEDVIVYKTADAYDPAPEVPQITGIEVNGNTVTITYAGEWPALFTLDYLNVSGQCTDFDERYFIQGNQVKLVNNYLETWDSIVPARFSFPYIPLTEKTEIGENIYEFYTLSVAYNENGEIVDFGKNHRIELDNEAEGIWDIIRDDWLIYNADGSLKRVSYYGQTRPERIWHEVILLYDEEGNLASWSTQFSGIQCGDVDHATAECKYDENGQITEGKISYWLTSEYDETTQRYYYYDRNHNFIYSSWFDPSVGETHYYDADGNEIPKSEATNEQCIMYQYQPDTGWQKNPDSDVVLDVEEILAPLEIVPVDTPVMTGSCGENLTWTLESGVLTVSGTGSMNVYPDRESVPWYTDAAKVKTIIVAEGVTGLSDHAFDGCRNVTAVTLPSTLTEIGNAAFAGCGKLAEVNYNGTLADWSAMIIGPSENGYLTGAAIHCTDGNIVSGSCDGFDWTLNGHALTVEGTRFDINNLPEEIQRQTGSISFGAGITEINLMAYIPFLPDALNVNEENAYFRSENGVLFNKDMTSLLAFPAKRSGSYSVPAGVKTLAYSAFAYSNLTMLVLPEGLERLETQAIYACGNLTQITIPASVTYIADEGYNFRYCTALENIYVAAGNTVYEDRDGILYEKADDRLFTYPAGRRTEQITVTGTVIGGAFGGNRYVTSVNIAEGVERIEKDAFSDSLVSSVSLPVSLQYIEKDAFANTPLTNVSYAGTLAQWASVRIGLNNGSLIANVQCQDGTASGHDYGGELGEGITYTLHEDTVTVSGAGTWDARYAFMRNNSIVHAVLEPGVTEIGWGTFSGCENLQTLQIPVSLTEIKMSALEGCGSLSDIYYAGTKAEWAAVTIGQPWNDPLYSAVIHCSDGDIGSVSSGACGSGLRWNLDTTGVLTIFGSGEMQNFASEWATPWYSLKDQIQRVVIHSGALSIGDYAFIGCPNLTAASLPVGIRTIGLNAFSRCSNLSEITLPNGLQEIKSMAFEASGLRSLVLPDTVTVLGIQCFFGTPMTSLTLSEGLTSLPYYCFAYGALTSLTIPANMTEISPYAFQGQGSLREVHLPAGLRHVDYSAFEGCGSLTDVYFDGTAAQAGLITFGSNNRMLTKALWHCTDGDVQGIGPTSGTCGENLTWALNNGELTITGHGAMAAYDISRTPPWESGKEDITSVVIQPGVTNISDYAFNSCVNLTSVSLPQGIETIGINAFSQCSSLREIMLPYGLKEIKTMAFESSGLQSLVLPDTVTVLGDQCFKSAPIASLTLSNGLTSIPYSAFSYGRLTTLTIPENLAIIEPYAFQYQSSLQTVYLPENLSNVRYSAFQDCYSLREVYYAGTIAETGGISISPDNTALTGALWHCSDGDVQGIVPAEEYCGGGLTWDLINGRLTIHGFDGMADFSQTNAPWNVRKQQIREIVIDEGVSSVGSCAFRDCVNLTSVTLPTSVGTIGDNAFDCCTNLAHVWYAGFEENWNWMAIGSGNAPLLNANRHYGGPAPSGIILRNDNPEISFYIGLPNGFDKAWSQNYLTGVFIENYTELHDYIGGEPEFSLTCPDARLNPGWRKEGWEEAGLFQWHLDVRLDEIPDTEMNVPLTIICTWGGLEAQTETTVHIKTLAVIPQGTDLPEEIILDLGETFTVEPHILPAGCTIPGYAWEIVGNSGEFEEFTTHAEAQDTQTSRTYTTVKSGRYEALVALQADTVIAGRFVKFVVRNADGTLPDPEPEAWEPVFPDTITPGQDIRVVIPEAAGAVSYNVSVYDGQFATFYDKVTSPGEYMIPAAAFSEGGWFSVSIGASDGITDDYKWSQKEYSGVAPASGLAPLKAAIVTTDIREGEPVSFALSAENPSRIIVQQWMSWEDAGFPGYIGGDWFVTDYLKNGGSSFSKFRQPSDGHYSFRFAALVNGKWTAWSNEALPGAAVINLPANLTTIESEAFANLPGPAVVRVPGTVQSIADDAFDEDVIIAAPAGSYAIEWAGTHNRLYIEE